MCPREICWSIRVLSRKWIIYLYPIWLKNQCHVGPTTHRPAGTGSSQFKLCNSVINLRDNHTLTSRVITRVCYLTNLVYVGWCVSWTRSLCGLVFDILGFFSIYSQLHCCNKHSVHESYNTTASRTQAWVMRQNWQHIKGVQWSSKRWQQ